MTALIVSGMFLSSAVLISATSSSSPPKGTERLGFWIDERDIWSGAGLCWSASQFVTNYFETAPYPSAMLFAEGFSPSGACSPGVNGEATWLSQVASDAQAAGLNVEITVLVFVNLSGETINGVADQTSAFQSWVATLGSHSNIYGMQYEVEYYGNTAAEEQSFYNIVTGAGYKDILNPGTSVNGVTTPLLDYSTYPYFGGTIPASVSSGSIGVGYGETGAPSGSTPNPAWTQQTVQAIINTSPANPFVFMYADNGGTGQPSFQLWNWSTLQNWIYSDPTYTNNFILSSSSPTTTTTTSSASTSVTSTPTTTTSTTSHSTSTTSHSTTTSSSSTTSHSTSTTSHSTSTTSTSSTQTSTSRTSTSSSTTTSTSTSHSTSSTSTTSTATTSATTTSTTTTTSSTTSTTDSTSTSSTTSSPSSSTTTSATTSVNPISTTTVTQTSPQTYPLSVEGGCPSSGAGSYVSGTMATIVFSGVCDRNGGSGIRVTSWSLDGGPDVQIFSNGTLSIAIFMNQAHVVVFNTVSQYALSLDYGASASLVYVTPPTVPGDFYWYDAGTSVTFTGTVGLDGSNVVGYSLDGGAATPVTAGSEFTASFMVDSPQSLVVVLSSPSSQCSSQSCAPTFSVTVQSSSAIPASFWVDGSYYSEPVTFSWAAGSVHNITAAAGGEKSFVRTEFSGWTGLADSPSNTVLLTVNGSGSLTAEYLKQELVTLRFSDTAGDPIIPQSVILESQSGKESLGANLTAWVTPGTTYTLNSVTWMDWNVVMSNDSTFNVAQPATLGFVLGVYPQTIKAEDVYGQPLQGATVTVTTLNGRTINVTTDGDGVAAFRVPVGLFSATVSYLGVSNQIISASEGSHTFAMSFVLSYPLVATVGAMLGGAAIFIFFKRGKKVTGTLQFFSD